MLPPPNAANPMNAGGAPPPPAPPGQASGPGGGPSLATIPQQGSALGGSPAGLGGQGDPKAILARAELLLKSGAISKQQFDMIVAKLGMGSGPVGAKPPMAQPPGQPPQGGMPSPQWAS